MSLKIGWTAETQASKYLVKQGLRQLVNNFRCRFGEIDIIMRDGEYIVFIEVRKRTGNCFGDAAATVTFAKQQKLIKTANYFLSMHNLHGKQPLRFDVFSIQGNPPQTEWIKNAFGQDF